MKKFIISVMIVCISATFLFAETPALLGNNENPFNGVDGEELTDTETQNVDGEGGIGIAVGAVESYKAPVFKIIYTARSAKKFWTLQM